MADLEILCCGGTIDKVYFDAKSSYQVGCPAVRDIAARARVELPKITSLMRKDSLDMTDDDRAVVAAAVLQSTASRVMIGHGTDTMAATARVVQAATTDKTVVFVGAFLPAAFRDSDADFNIGFALAAAMLLPSGVYVAMNGRVMAAERVRKNVDAGRFED